MIRFTLRKDILLRLKEKGYTQTKLLNERVVGGTTLNAIRNGSNNITIASLEKIANLLECSISELIKEEKI